MTNYEDLIVGVKSLRVQGDALLQAIKLLKAKSAIDKYGAGWLGKLEDEKVLNDANALFEARRHMSLAIEHAEDTIMRLGMTLKALGTPNPYPNSYNPENAEVDKTADGLTL